MASATAFPGTVLSDDSLIGNYDWTDQNNVKATDNAYATADGGDSSIRNSASSAGCSLVVSGVYDNYTPANANDDELPTTEAAEAFGGASDKWGWTPVLATVQSSDFGCSYAVNAPLGNGSSYVLVCTGFDFSAIPGGSTVDGFTMNVEKKRIGGVAYIDSISLTVHYTASGGATTNPAIMLSI